MDEDERQRKLQAGKEKFAEFLRKKNSPKKKKKKSLDGRGDSSEITVPDDSNNLNKTTSSLHENYLHNSSVDETSLEDVEISFSDTLDDSRWTNEKILELEHSMKTKQTKLDEVHKENISLNDQFSNSISHEDVHFTVKSDDLRETDYRSMVEEYRRRIEEFQTALLQRDDIITQLSDRLMMTLQNRDAIQMEAAVQAEGLAKEISILKLQLQQASEILGRQKDKDGISAEDLLEARNQIISLNEELHCVKENVNKLQHQNILLVQEIEMLKTESSSENSKCQLESLLMEKELLIQEVHRLKCVEDEIIEMKEKSSLSDILIKQLQEDNERLMQEAETRKSEFSNEELKYQLDSLIKEKELLNNEVDRLKCIEDELSQVKERSKLSDTLIKQLQEHNTCLLQEIETRKIEPSSEELKHQLDSLIKEKELLSIEVDKLKAIEDELNQAKEKARLSDSLIKQLQEDHNCLQEQNVQIKSELDVSLQQSAHLSCSLETANTRIEELIKKQEKYEKVLIESRQAECTIEQLTNELLKTQKELDNAQKQLISSQVQLEDINHKYVFLQEEYKKLHESYSCMLENTKEELKEKHEEEVEEKETMSKKLVSSVQEKLMIQEEKYRNKIEILESKHADEILKYEEQYNNLLERKEELENIVKSIENPSFLTKVSLVEKNFRDTSLHNDIITNNENSCDGNMVVNLTEVQELKSENMLPFPEPSYMYDDTVDSAFPQFILDQSNFEKSVENIINCQNVNSMQMQGHSLTINDSYHDENLLLQNTSYLSLKWLKEFTNNQELENYVDDAVLRIKKEKTEIERHLLDHINNLELANCDLQSKVEELKIQYDHLKSCKESLENELSEKGQHTSEIFETNALDSLFDNDNAVEPFSVTMYTTEIAILKNKLLLECSIKESLSSCVNHLKRKCDVYEKYKNDMSSQLDGMRDQLKYAWQQYDKVVKELFEISIYKSTYEDNISPLKSDTSLHKRINTVPSDSLLIENETNVLPTVSNNLDAEVEALHLELKEMKELFTKENTQLRIALEHQQQSAKTCSDAQEFCSMESNETLDISHKLVLLADSNRELLEKKEKLQSQLVQQDQLLTDIWNAFHDDETGQNLLQEHLDKLNEQSKEIMQELQQHNSVHNTVTQILSNNVFQKYLQVHKELCLSKIYDKELLEAEIIRLRKDLELQSKELQQLEVKLENKNTLEQTLNKQKRVLQEELSEIQQKLREHQENILKEKALLETELREKDLILKKTELEVQHKEVELQGQTAALKADYEACLSNMHIKVSEETWNHITKLRNDLEVTHQQAMQFLKNNLEKECAMKELKTAEEHMNEVAELKAYHKEQIAALHAQLEARMAAIREEGYIEIIGVDDIAHKLKQKWNDYHAQFTSLRSQLDETQQNALDKVFDHWKELHNEELEQFKQKFNVKIEEELHNQRERMLKMNHSALESFEAGLNQEKLEALCEQHEILTEQHNEQLDYIQKRNEKEMEILKNIHKMQLEQLFIQQKPINEVQAAKHKIAEHHYRCIQDLVSKWTGENIKRLDKLRIIVNRKDEEDSYNPDKRLKYTVEDVEDLLLERKTILNEVEGIKDYINNNINNVDLLKDHLLQAYETLLDTYQSKMDSECNNEGLLAGEGTNSLMKLNLKEIDGNLKAIEKSSDPTQEIERINQLPNISLERINDIEQLNASSHTVLSALEIEEYYIKQYEQKIEQYKMQLDNVIKELISKHHNAEETLRQEFETQLSVNLELISTQLGVKHRKEIEQLVENFHIEKSDLQKKFIENVAKEVTKVRVACAENAAENYAIENEKLLQKHQIEIENLKKEMNEEFSKEKADLCTENVQRFKELMETYTLEKNKLMELLETEKMGRKNDQEESRKVHNEFQQTISALNIQLCRLQQEKSKLEQDLEMQIADLIQDHNQEIEVLRDKLCMEFKEEKNNLLKGFAVEVEKLKSIHNENMDDLWKKLEKEYKEEKITIKAEEEKRFSDVTRMHTNEIEKMQLKIDELHEEKHILLSNHAAEIANMTSYHQQELENILSKLQLKIHEEKGDLVDQVSTRVGEDIVRLRSTLEQATIQVASEVAKVIKEKNLDLNGKAMSEDLEATLSNLRSDLDAKTRALEELQAKYTSEITDVESQECRGTILPDSDDSHFSFPSEKVLIDREDKSIITDETCQDLNLKSELMEEMEQLQSQMEKDMAAYTQENSRLFEELKQLEATRRALESDLEKATAALKEKEKQAKSPEQKQNKEWLTGTELSTVDIRSWQVQTAQTNSRLLHVLSDLVKTFFDIEQDINSRLIQLGLDVINSTDGGATQDEEGALISAQGTIGGSREDFSMFMSETINLELSEDGIDLTPRSWDLFTSSIAAHEVEMEGEDVVLGASKRLRSAVDRVLRLLSLAVEVQQHQDLRVLLCRNEELSRELQEEVQNRDSLQMELIRVEGLLRNTEQEKQKLEDCAHVLKEAKDLLTKELDLLRQRLHHLEETQDTLTEEKRYAVEQCQMITSTLGKPEQTTTEDIEVTACTETVSPEQEVLLQENSKLSTERHRLQQSHDKERQRLLSHIHHLELALEESNSQKEDILEEKSKEIEDLKSQMESIEKQLFSYKKFIEEQAQEREQERDEYLREVRKLNDIVREKERIQNNEDRLTREIETLENQLRTKIEDHADVLRRREKLEADLRQSIDKIHDLRDVISELECQLEIKSRQEADLKQQILNLEEAISNHEKESTEINNELEQLRTISNNNELNDHIRALEDQLESKGQQLEQMINCQSVLQEFRGHIHSLEAKIDNKVRHLETQKSSLLSASPVPSDDTSFCGSQEGERRPLSVEDVRVYSPSSLTWDEMKRFEDKIDHLVKMEEELFKRNKDMEQQIKNSKQADEEMVHVKNALQEQVNSQLLTISALRAQIEEKKHNSKQDSNNRMKTEIAQLKESLESEKQQQEFLENKIQELKVEICRLEQQLQEKEETQKENVYNKTESEVLIQELSSVKDENSELKHEVEKLRFASESSSLPDYAKLLLDDKNEEIDYLNQQIHNLQGLLETFQNANKPTETTLSEIKKELDVRNKEMVQIKSTLEEREKEIEELNKQVDAYKKEITELKQNLENVEDSHDSLEPVLEDLIIKQSACVTGDDANKRETQEPDSCKHCIKLEIALAETTSIRDNLQQQVNALVSELDSFAKHHGMTNRVSDKGSCDMLDKLQEDFDTMQKIAEKKEEELVQLQEEAETQVQLQSKLQELQNTLDLEGKDICAKNKEIKELNEKVKKLQNSLEEAQEAHEKQVISWHQQIEKINHSHAKAQEALRQEVICLREQFPEKEKSPALDTIGQGQSEEKKEPDESPLADETSLHMQNFTDNNIHNDFTEINNPNCKECIRNQKMLESARQNFMQEKTQLVTFLKKAESKTKECEFRLEEETKNLKRKYEAEISDMQLQWEKVENLLRNTHQEEIEHIKTCLEEAFQDEKKMIIQIHDQQIKSTKQDLEEKYENERLELVRQFEEILRTSKEKMERKLTVEKEKLECLYKEKCNMIQVENEKITQSEKAGANEKENLHKTYEEEKKQLIILHKRELDKAEKDAKENLSNLQNTLDKTYKEKFKQLELKHKQEIKTLKDLLKKTKSEATSRDKVEGGLFSSRECTPLSDGTSSHGTTTSPEEEMQGVLSINVQKLLDKVYKEGVKVLSLTERQLLKHHLTPPSENGNFSALTADWLRERQILLDEIHSLKELIKEQGSEVNSWEHIVEQIAVAFRKEQEKLITELRDQARNRGEVNQIDGKSLENRISDLELQKGVVVKQITQGLIDELKNARNDLSNQCNEHKHIIEDLQEKLHFSEEQKSQIEWQLKTQRDLLEFRAKQEKVLADDLQISLDAEKTRNLDLTAQLNKQHKAVAELEMSNSSSQAEILCLRQSLEEEKQRLSSCMNALDMEKSHSQSLFQALESERASFSHLQVALESERQRGKAVREHDQQIIRDLREMLLMAEGGNSSSKFSIASMHMETERLRSTESRLSDKISLPSNDFQDLDLVPTSSSVQVCQKCARLEKMLAKERTVWVEQHTNLNRSLQEANNEVLRLKHLIQTVDLEKDTNGMDAKLHHLYWRYRRSESYRQALIFQKNYLLMLLSGFQSTEEATITALVHMGTNNAQESNGKLALFSRGGRVVNGLFRFKSAAYAVLALYRMKYLVRRWQKAAQVPSSRAVAQEVDSIEQAFTELGMKNGTDKSHPVPPSSLYKHYLASKSFSPSLVQGGSAILDRTETSSLRRLSPKASSVSGTGRHDQGSERGRLGEYITRLEFLHRRLGLDSTKNVVIPLCLVEMMESKGSHTSTGT